MVRLQSSVKVQVTTKFPLHSSNAGVKEAGTEPVISQMPDSPLVYKRADGENVCAISQEIVMSAGKLIKAAGGAGVTVTF